MQNTKTPQRKLRHVSWTLLKLFYRLSWDQNFTLCPQAGRSCFFEHAASSCQPPVGLSRISCDCINDNSEPQGAKCTQRLTGAAATTAGLSKRVWCNPSLSRTFHVNKESGLQSLFCCPSSLPRMACALRRNEIVS